MPPPVPPVKPANEARRAGAAGGASVFAILLIDWWPYLWGDALPISPASGAALGAIAAYVGRGLTDVFDAIIYAITARLRK